MLPSQKKSQRYVTFGKDYVIPKEFTNRPKLKQPYKKLMDELFAEYEFSFNALNELYKKQKRHSSEPVKGNALPKKMRVTFYLFPQKPKWE